MAPDRCLMGALQSPQCSFALRWFCLSLMMCTSKNNMLRFRIKQLITLKSGIVKQLVKLLLQISMSRYFLVVNRIDVVSKLKF